MRFRRAAVQRDNTAPDGCDGASGRQSASPTATGKMPPVMVVVDKAGRIVIPKSARDRLDLLPGTQLELEVLHDAIQLERRKVPGRQLAWTEDGRPYFPARPGHVTTDADVQHLRDALER